MFNLCYSDGVNIASYHCYILTTSCCLLLFSIYKQANIFLSDVCRLLQYYCECYIRRPTDYNMFMLYNCGTYGAPIIALRLQHSLHVAVVLTVTKQKMVDWYYLLHYLSCAFLPVNQTLHSIITLFLNQIYCLTILSNSNLSKIIHIWFMLRILRTRFNFKYHIQTNNIESV